MDNTEKIRELAYQMRAIFNGNELDRGVGLAQQVIDLLAPAEPEGAVVSCSCGCGATLPDNGRDEAGKLLPRRRA
jgi:hypothetical protein